MSEHHKRTDAMATRVQDLLDAGVTLNRIAYVVGICTNTLWDHYADILEGRGDEPGLPKFIPTEQHRKQVTMMSALGMTQKDMMANLGISREKLIEYFSEEMAVGQAQANMQVGGNLFKMAMGDPTLKNTVVAAIWWSKARMGWRDTTRVENTGADGGPIRTESQVQIFLPDNGRGDGPEPTPGIEYDAPQIEAVPESVSSE